MKVSVAVENWFKALPDRDIIKSHGKVVEISKDCLRADFREWADGCGSFVRPVGISEFTKLLKVVVPDVHLSRPSNKRVRTWNYVFRFPGLSDDNDLLA